MLQLCLFSIIKFIINDIIQICVHKEERSSRYIFNKKKIIYVIIYSYLH